MLKVCSDILKALDYLHTTAKVLHGDIKSFNVLVKNAFSICKLCDFGVSLPLNEDGFVDLERKPDAKYIGTSLWCAPEALIDDNEVNISYKADIFSFGLVLYECIALIPPHSWAMSDICEDNSSVIEIEDSVIEIDDSIVEMDESEGKENCSQLSNSRINEIETSKFKANGIQIESSKDLINDSQLEDESVMDDDEMVQLYGTRPPMPESDELSEEYNVIMELFYVCTMQDPEDRPAASGLSTMFDDKH